MDPGTVFLTMIFAVLVIIIISKAVYVVRQHERGVIATFGKYTRTAEPGLNFVMPFFQTLQRVDMRETVLDVIPQAVITKDNAACTVDAVVYYEVTDPFRRIYNVVDFRTAAIKLAQTNLRNIIGTMQIDEVLVSREKVNTELREVLDDATDHWGVRVTRVELQAVEPPRDIVDAMSRQMKAEREKRAVILDAEGVRQSQILEAEGERQARILRAEGEAGAIREIADADKFRQYTGAEGEALAITTVFSAIHEGDPTHDLLAVKYLEMLAKVADGQATKIFLPLEASGMLAGIAAAGEVFAEGQSGPAPSAPTLTPPSPPA